MKYGKYTDDMGCLRVPWSNSQKGKKIMKRSVSSMQPRLQCECLEQRMLLAGVQAAVLDGVLTVTGTKKDNCIDVTGNRGGIVVTETCGGKINGVTDPF